MYGADGPAPESQPHRHQQGREVQRFGQLREMPLGLAAPVRGEMAAQLNKVLSDTRILHGLYKKSHWLMCGPTFYQLHLLMDKHAGEQDALVDAVAERVQTLGAVAVGDPRHVAELTSVPRPPDGAESSATNRAWSSLVRSTPETSTPRRRVAHRPHRRVERPPKRAASAG
jgi:starvation-inducible DNA-binding protein